MTITITEKNIIINESVCWICGKPFSKVKGKNRTIHHALPQHCKPVKNILVPIHESCHNRINRGDINSIISFAYKLQKETAEITKKITALQNQLIGAKSDNTIEIKEKQNEKKK